MFGFYRVALISPKLSLANPKETAKEMVKLIKEADKNSATITLFSELTLIGYSVGDLIYQNHLLSSQMEGFKRDFRGY